MIRTPDASSNLSSVGFDPTQQILEVQFLSHPTKLPGDIYDYYGVSQTIYDGLMDASSKGHYLYTVIKKGGYAYRKVYDSNTGEGEPNGIVMALSESMLNPTNLLTPTVTPIVAAGAIASATPTVSDIVAPVMQELGEIL